MAEVMSPLPMIGMCMRGLFFTSPISVQSASPVYICARVRPWMANAAMPQSCNCSARSTMILWSASQPSRVFTVTGIFTASTTVRVISSIFGIFCNIPAPAPFPATFFTGHPKLMSSMSGRASSTIRAAPTMASVSLPYICMATGRSSSQIVSFCVVLLTERISASLETNSVYTISAPNFLHIRRKAGSVTSSIGAKKIGCSPKSIWLIFICCLLNYAVYD